MYCKNCGNKLKDNANFCADCGFKIKESTDTKFISSISKEDLIKLFVGNNYDKISSFKFSFPTFFLGPIYLLYRKQYLVSLAWIIFIILLNIIIPRYAFILLILFSLIFSYFFNEYYILDVSKKIDDILNNSSYTSDNELEKIIKKTGGITIGPFVVLLSIFFVFAIIFLYIMIIDYLNSEIQPRNNPIVNDNL